MQHIPNHSGKKSIADIKDAEKVDLDESALDLGKTALFYWQKEGLWYDAFWRPKKSADKIFVLFCGDALRDKNDPPVFQRWSWAKFFPGHCLYVSDPSLYLDDTLGLAWYSGTKKVDPLPEIVSFIMRISKELGVSISNIYLYGSSGGGFAAIRALSLEPRLCAIAINPQTSIVKYEKKHVEKYFGIAFGTASREEVWEAHANRVDLVHIVDLVRNSRLILIQNSEDRHHFNDHYVPFCEAMGVGPDEDFTHGSFRRILFKHKDGHKKAETQEVFDLTMNMVLEGF